MTNGLSILDVSNPSQMQEVGNLYLQGTGYDVYLSGDLAYFADGDSGLQIINVADTKKPTLIGHVDTPGNAVDILVNGNHAYVADRSSGVQVIDVSDPSKPTISSSYSTGGEASDLAVSGPYLYIAAGEAGLAILDISNPGKVAPVGHVDNQGFDEARSVAISGSYAYILGGDKAPSWTIHEGVWIDNPLWKLLAVDISNPQRPIKKQGVPCGATATARSFFKSIIRVYEKVIYVAYVDRVEAFELQCPAFPRLKAKYLFEADSRSLDIKDNRAYCYPRGKFVVWNLSDPEPMKSMNVYYPYGGSDKTAGIIDRVSASGSNAFVSAGQLELQVLDVSHSDQPRSIGQLSGPGVGIADMVVDGKFIYTIHITEPDFRSRVVTGQRVFRIVAPHEKFLEIKGWGLTSISGKSIRVFDVANPNAPSLVGSYENASRARCLKVKDEIVYIGSDTGLQLLKVSGDKSLTLLGELKTPRPIGGIEVQGVYAYLYAAPHSGYKGGPTIYIVDVSNPRAPVFKGTYQEPGEEAITGVTVKGHVAYVTYTSRAIKLIDPTGPRMIHLYDTAGEPQGVAFSDPYVLVPCGEAGLQVFEVSPEGKLQSREIYNTPGDAKHVAVADNHIYLADADSLMIFRLRKKSWLDKIF
jgi:hypothetical protein